MPFKQGKTNQQLGLTPPKFRKFRRELPGTSRHCAGTSAEDSDRHYYVRGQGNHLEVKNISRVQISSKAMVFLEQTGEV